VDAQGEGVARLIRIPFERLEMKLRPDLPVGIPVATHQSPLAEHFIEHHLPGNVSCSLRAFIAKKDRCMTCWLIHIFLNRCITSMQRPMHSLHGSREVYRPTGQSRVSYRSLDW